MRKALVRTSRLTGTERSSRVGSELDSRYGEAALTGYYWKLDV